MSVSINSKILSINNKNIPVSLLKIGDKVWSIDIKSKHLKISTIMNIDYVDEDLYNTGVNDLYVSKDQQLYISNKEHHPSFREYFKLNRKDATYNIRIWPSNYIRNQYDDEKFALGYIRGFIDGDGCIGDRGVRVFQKDKNVIEEIFDLYNKYIQPCNICIKETPVGSGVYKGAGGYTPVFINKTNYNNDEEYMRGYLNGMIMADGCASYNKSNSSFGVSITQSISANPQKCNIIQTYLDNLNYSYDLSDSKCGGFLKEKSTMRNWRITRPFILSFEYGTNKMNNFLLKFQKYLTIRSFKKLKINKFTEKSHIREKSVNIITDSGTFFCNGCLLKSN